MSTPHTPLEPDVVTRLILDTDPWLSCDDCFRLVDTYVESLLDDAGRDLAERDAMSAHLRGCPACLEEAATVLVLAAEDRGSDPEAALVHLERTIDPSGRPER